MPDPSSSIFPGTSRSNSLASSVSSSATGLTRRSRTVTRKRTRTITGGSRQDGVKAEEDLVLDISSAYSVELVSSPVASPPPETSYTHGVTHPGAGSDVLSNSDIHSSGDADRSNGTFGTFGPLVVDEPQELPGAYGPIIPSESQPGTHVEPVASSTPFKGKARNPARITSPPSSFKPTLAEGDQARSNVRDSLLTQQSSTSSSVYPVSTSTGTESPPSPLSPAVQERGLPIPAFDIDGAKVQEFDADDVSYRLRLLVKNSYFLPPAHYKPSPSDFPPSAINNSKKAPAPAFLDLFRVGKSKSKPTSPDATNGASPMLRVTSDSTTAFGYVQRDQGRPSPQTFRPPPGSQHLARVVVVREKMDDLVAAARQAEMDLKTHDFLMDRERSFRKSKPTVFDGIVDPTETVDVPPPSANYPLALQASALHGLGIEDSVGAAVLAERLPPPGSPGLSTLDPREDAWRKALLRQAVGHSLNNSVVTSAASISLGHSTPTRSPRYPRSSESLHHRAVQQQREMLDRKILSHPIIDPSEDFEPPVTSLANLALNPTGLVATLAAPDLRRLSNYEPLRAETPIPHTPLSPPPRRVLGNPQFSQSQTELSPARREALAHPPRKALRKSISSPMLSDAYEPKTIGMITPSKSPPPLPSLSVSPAPSSIHAGDHRMSRMTAFSRYTGSEQDDIVVVTDDPPSRPSLALSLPTTDGRASISEYSQPSPTASAFRDRWSDGYYSTQSPGLTVEPPNHSRESSTSPQQFPRLSTMSPPPRSSSSIAGIALSPPPRAGYLPFQPTPSRLTQSASRTSSDASRITFRSFTSISPLPPQQTRTPVPPLNLNISVHSFHSALHSAPPPSSTTEFFDHIQSHPNAMDDLDDSDETASETDRDMTAVYAASAHGASLTRLGNLSTPNIVRGANEPYYPSAAVIPKERKKPVGHVPQKTPYFSSVKSSPDSLTHLSLSQHSREHLIGEESTPARRPATAGEENVRRWQREQQAQALEESSKRLDGMLIQHMQAEKDTLKRITQTAKVSKS
ncbi:hypothetical protein HYDPIDRAFT_180665 [Hydnomerulius pinastri MD-312]|nr:hypothetical protein HYDPIDRAFT_180665 [Hydnomerulius pinastri MD-312]